MQEDRPAHAEWESRLAVDEFRKANAPDNLAMADCACPTLLAQQKIEEAQNIVAEALKTASKGSRATQIGAATDAAEIQTATGNGSPAANSLKQLIADSHKAGFVPSEFRARLALGKAEIRAGHSTAGRAFLASLEREGNARGFLPIESLACVRV
jgi:hypothetical protein